MRSGVLYWTPRNGSLSIGFCKHRRNNIRGEIINLKTMNLWTVNFVCNRDIFINALKVLVKSLYQTYFIFIRVLYLLFFIIYYSSYDISIIYTNNVFWSHFMKNCSMLLQNVSLYVISKRKLKILLRRYMCRSLWKYMEIWNMTHDKLMIVELQFIIVCMTDL